MDGTVYLALLRGINVGGKNKISMPDLKFAFEQAGFLQVTTYINSGNVIFIDPNFDEQLNVQSRCETLVSNRFQLQIAVCVMTASSFLSALARAPERWAKSDHEKHNAIFVIPPAKAEDVIVAVGEIKPEYERVGFFGNIIFWSAPVKTFSKTRWSKVAANRAYRDITIRNANTTQKLATLVQRLTQENLNGQDV